MEKIKLTVLFTVLMSMAGLNTLAHDIEMVNADGVTIYYNFIGNNELEVTYGGTHYVYTATSIVIPASIEYEGNIYDVTRIGSHAFDRCNNLSSISIPTSVRSIGDMAFGECTSLATITIPDGVTSIETMAFVHCSVLSSIIIPNSVANIDTSVFYDTAWYENQPDGMIYAGKVAYGYKGTMPDNTSIVINEGTVGIAGGAFHYCKGLSSITIPDGVTNIGNQAFINCTDLTSVSIPNSVSTIGSDAFTGTPWYENQPDGLVYAGKVVYSYKGIMPDNTNVVLNEGTVGIGYSAFSYCTGLSSVTIPNSVIRIQDYAFYGCVNLTSIDIPNSVTSIEINAFSDCKSLSSITIPNSITKIIGSFSGCTGLTNVNIPSSVTIIGQSAFSGCTELTNVNIPSSVTIIGLSAFSGCTELTSVVIPNSVKKIGEGAFKNCSNLTSVNILSNIKKIESGTFNNCEKLSSINIPNSVTSIEARAFQSCYNLTSIEIPSNVTTIAAGAFMSTGLTSIRIPANVANIENNPFTYCYSLNSIEVDSNNPYYDSRNDCNAIIQKGENKLISGCCNTIIPNGVKTIGRSAFAGCIYLTSVSIPNSVSNIGLGAFMYSGLSSIDIPNTVNNIAADAFESCPLTYVNTGNGVTGINENTFKNCNQLTTIYIGSNVKHILSKAFNFTNSNETPVTVVSLNENPVNIDSSAFSSQSYNTGTLYVPIGTIDKYKACTGWKEFLNITDTEPSGVKSVMQRTDVTMKDIYSLDGKLISQPKQGLNIIKMNDGTTKKVVVK